MYKEKMVSAIIVAAGNGSRMGDLDTSKVFLKLDEQHIIEHTINAFDQVEEIDEIILVLRREDEEYFNTNIDLNKYKRNISITFGGDSREESTWNGLSLVNPNSDVIVTHDGARPFISSDIIREIIDNAIEKKAVITAVPVKDTIKIVERARDVKFTPKRSTLYSAQTPQAFGANVLKRAYEIFMSEDFEVTDDASIVEKAGYKVQMILGDYKNIKITTLEDLSVGKVFLEEMK